jgi:hypothetical protein
MDLERVLVADREGAVDGRADAHIVRVVEVNGGGQQLSDMPTEERLRRLSSMK